MSTQVRKCTVFDSVRSNKALNMTLEYAFHVINEELLERKVAAPV
jgi:hypothetical protein